MNKAHTISKRHQRGAALFVTLIFLLIITLIAVTAARMQTVEEQMARNDDNHQLALQSAEATLRQAEAQLQDGIYTDANFQSNANGTYVLTTEPTAPASVVDNGTLPAGALSYTGPALSNPPVTVPAAKYVIEALPPVATPGQPMCASMYGSTSVCSVTRTTVQAVGADNTSTVTVQSIYH
jgi:type IV pilus assembly protein PilX